MLQPVEAFLPLLQAAQPAAQDGGVFVPYWVLAPAGSALVGWFVLRWKSDQERDKRTEEELAKVQQRLFEVLLETKRKDKDGAA